MGDTLRIKPAFLAALEENRPQDLPGPTYVIGFVRAYARYLGLDPNWVLDRYKAGSTGIGRQPDLALPVPLSERGVPGGPILLVALLLGICGYGTWYYLSTGDRNRPERIPAVPPTMQSQTEQANTSGSDVAVPAMKRTIDPAAATTPADPKLSSGVFAGSAAATAGPGRVPAFGAADFSASTASDGPPSAQPEPPIAAATASPAGTPAGVPIPAASATAQNGPQAGLLHAAPLQPASPQPAPPTAMAAPPQSSTAGNNSSAVAGRIEVKAAADCWVQVRAPDQSIVFSRVLKAGETYRVPARPGLVMRAGNAGALSITVDGKPAPSIGPAGALRRNVVLDPDALLGGTAVQG